MNEHFRITVYGGMRVVKNSHEMSSTYPNYTMSEKNRQYQSLIDNEAKKILIGVPSSVDFDSVADCESVAVVWESQCSILNYNIPNYFLRKLSFIGDERAIITKITEDYIEAFNVNVNVGEQWDYLLGFLIAYYQKNLSKLAKDYFGKYCQISPRLDSMEKMKKSEVFRKKNKVFAKAFSAYNMISPSYIENGEGNFYMMNQEHLEDIHKRFKQDYFEEAIKNNSEFDLNEFLKSELKYKENEDYSIYHIFSINKTMVFSEESRMIIDELIDLHKNKKQINNY